MNRKLFGAIAAATLGCTIGVTSYAQSERPRFSYGYVVVTYKCNTTGKAIAVISQVFGACYQETNHAQIAGAQRLTYDQVARASCGAATTFDGQRSSYAYTGPVAEDTANRDRAKDVVDYIGYGFKVESTFLQTPSSSRCR